ncbi:uncharacterized protein LOC141902265 [Tubulanus polymorphus]|uniref:uncharacterized protein LOC141902265 n=1 Tax=Tubulanus polymorphus TaxID=672921 RepID=UPI003DA49E60
MSLEDKLQEAVSANDISKIQQLIASGVNINEDSGASYMFYPPVLLAVMKQSWDALNLLISTGADLNCIKHRTTPLICAAKTGNIQICRLLVENGADINQTDDWGEETALRSAISCGNIDLIRYLIQNGSDLSTMDEAGRTIIYHAVKCENIEVIETLLSFTSEINGINLNNCFSGYSVLFPLVSANKTEMICKLVRIGADLNALNRFGYNLLHEATDFVVKPETMRQILKLGVSVNYATSSDHVTPLHMAVCKGNLEKVYLLVNHGANCNVLTNAGESPLYQAVYRNYKQIAEFLIRCGAETDPNNWHFPKDGINRNELLEFIYEQKLRVVKSLKHTTRLVIRSCITDDINKKVYLLQLPKLLKDYLMFTNEC